jgi:hypothetical protein
MPKIPKNTKKILKNIQKFPHLYKTSIYSNKFRKIRKNLEKFQKLLKIQKYPKLKNPQHKYQFIACI